MRILSWSAKITLLLAGQAFTAWFSMLADPFAGLLVFTTVFPFLAGLLAGRYLRLGLLSTLLPFLPIPLASIVFTLYRGVDIPLPIPFGPRPHGAATSIHVPGGGFAKFEALGLLWILGCAGAGWGLSRLISKWLDPADMPGPGLY